ncbi:uncharacterized protein LOC135472456 [Liolophura sinensis]|uniref:uncharacterized protein LOC135472456 n=1 Tax=Liolophura sinensis TaxID=3198878 RepID=UPI003158CFBB
MAEPGKNLTSSLPPSPLPSYMATTNEEVQTDPLSQSFSETAAGRRNTYSSVNGPIVKSAGGIEPTDVFHHSYKSQTSVSSTPANMDTYVVVGRPNNEIEAHKIANNHLFGFKKWKSHLSSRPLSERSDVVKELYDDINKIKPVRVSTVRPSNLLYVLLFGWWISLIYLFVGALLMITIVGRVYGPFCWKMAKYFIWPFGKFVHQIHPVPLAYVAEKTSENGLVPSPEGGIYVAETTALLSGNVSLEVTEPEKPKRFKCDKSYWCRPRTIVWLILGCPLLLLAHGITIFISWLLVVTIPIAKVNIKTVQKILFLPPEQVQIGDSGVMTVDLSVLHSEIIMYTHQSVNIYYYKYTVDGMNVILVNLLVFVVVALILGYSDPDNNYTSGFVKCIMSLLAIVPLTYYIGMGIACIAAQSVLAVGAIMNATFGSAVEVILYIIFLVNGLKAKNNCYVELVKSAMAGTLLATMMLIPGLSMVAGGLKYRTQRFNPQSAGVSASLLFVSVAGIFAPTIFSKVYGTLQCQKCENYTTNSTTGNGSNVGIQCSECEQSIFGLNGDKTLYDSHIKPLVYACAIMLPISYIIGLIFTLKTHKSVLYETTDEGEPQSQGHHAKAHWSKLKSAIIMLACAVLISLCADLVTENIQPLLQVSGISEYFIGVTLLAVVPELPEVVNGIQFALQNNVALGLEIGSSTAVQVCLVQIPLMVLVDLIYPFDFYLVFNDIHLWAVIFSVIVMNYTFQDGKSDYFQGWILVGIYLVILAMYFFTPVPPEARCSATPD